MIREIYTREPSDPNYVDHMLDVNDPIEEIVTKVRMILGTVPGEVLGFRNLGVDIEKLVFQTQKSAQNIEQEIFDSLNEYVNGMSQLYVTVKVQFGHGESSDYATIDVMVNDERVSGFVVE